MPEFNEKRMRCNFCKNEGADQKIFVTCPTYGLSLCCTKEKLLSKTPYQDFIKHVI